MRTAAGQCCFYTMPRVDSLGRARHAAIRTYENLCDNWLVLHKARSLTRGSGIRVWAEDLRMSQRLL